ncbi:hypothetical protein [Klebsiella pneumoniae]
MERTSVRRWVRAWQFHGAEGLTAKNNHYLSGPSALHV